MVQERNNNIAGNNKTRSVGEEIKALAPLIHPPVPNPAPLGLFAFGLTTALLQLKHTRLAGSSDADMEGVEHMTWGYAMFFGGLLQIIAGLCEIKRNNIFGFTAFLTYGGFWMSLGTSEIVILLAKATQHPEALVGINSKAAQGMLALMGIFTFVLWLCTLKMNKTISALIFMLMMTFFLLAAGVDDETTDYVAGYFGLFTAAIAYWLGAAELVNDIVFEGKEKIPLGHWAANKYKFAGGQHVPGRIHDVTTRTVLKEDTRFGGLWGRRRSTMRMVVPQDKTPEESNGREGEPDKLDLELGK